MATVTHQAQAIELGGSRSIESANDHELLAAIRDGDEAAFQEIVRRYRNPITNFVYRMIDDYERAVELAQETFIRVYTSASRYQANYSFSTYIYRIASNLAISELRRRKRRKVVSLFSPFTNDDGEMVEIDPPDSNPLQDEAMIENERRRAVARAITSLPEKYRAAIVLRDVEGLSYDRIAEVLKLSEGTVKSRINRARNLLKEKLSAYI
jgi:RNA polymerase sigma-70 factor, ECF subfamily